MLKSWLRLGHTCIDDKLDFKGKIGFYPAMPEVSTIIQIGYPVITVKDKGDGVHIRQNRYLKTGEVKEEDDQTIWYVHFHL